MVMVNRRISTVVMDFSKATIEAQFKDGSLVATLSEGRWVTDDAAVVDEFVDMHNAGRIDLAMVVKHDAFEQLVGHKFFVVQHFFDRAIPKLENISAERMMELVAALVRKGGTDLAANEPNRAFLEWCTNEPTRADFVIEAARNGNELAQSHLTFALQARKDIGEAQKMTNDPRANVRLSALTALSRIAHSTDDERAATIAALRLLLDGEPDDALKAHVLVAAINPFEEAGVALTGEARDIVRFASRQPGPICVHQAAHLLLICKACLSPEIVSDLLDCARCVSAEHGGTVDLLDTVLGKLLKSGHGAAAVQFAKDVLSRSDGALSAEKFDGFARNLAQNREALNRLVLDWMLSGNQRLCQAVSGLIRQPGDAPIPLDLQFGALTETQVYFVCRKAVGYLFLQPVLAGSVLVSALRTAQGRLADTIVDLLFEPMLVNYGGELRLYLEGIQPDDASYTHVRKALERRATYLAGLEAAGVIAELHPSEYRRQLERIRQVDFSREVNKKAHQQSIFWDIVHRSVLLHGSGSVTFVEDGAGGRRPVSMQMQRHEVSTEWPRMETVDPVGLDLMLRTFRVEQFKS